MTEAITFIGHGKISKAQLRYRCEAPVPSLLNSSR